MQASYGQEFEIAHPLNPLSEDKMKNLKVSAVILDAMGVLKSKPEDLAILLTRAIRADAIGNADDYTAQCSFIKDLINEGPVGPKSKELIEKLKSGPNPPTKEK